MRQKTVEAEMIAKAIERYVLSQNVRYADRDRAVQEAFDNLREQVDEAL